MGHANLYGIIDDLVFDQELDTANTYILYGYLAILVIVGAAAIYY